MSAERARVFLALPLGAELGNALSAFARAALGATAREFRWPRPDGMHLTLLFVGDVERSLAVDLWREVEARLVGARAPRLSIGTTGSFPGQRGRERVLWFAAEPADSPDLVALRSGVLDAAESAGLDVREERARPFRAHLTVARPRAARPRVAERFYAGLPARAWTPLELALFESVPSPGGARYVALETLPLTDDGGA